MAVSTAQLVLMSLFGILTLVGLWMLYAVMYNTRASTNLTKVRGANGVAGDTVTLSCPAGQYISFEKANLIHVDMNGSAFGTIGCDPSMFGGGSFNPSTTLNALQIPQFPDLAACIGMESCEVTVPGHNPATAITWNPNVTTKDGPPTIPTSGVGTCGGANTQLIATYNCVLKRE